MLLAGIVLGLVVGLLSGGRLRRLRSTSIGGETVLLLALVAQLAVATLISRTHRCEFVLVAVWALLFVVVAAVALANSRAPGMVCILAGTMMNIAVIAANRGMPVSVAAMRIAGFSGSPEFYFQGRLTHHALDSQTKLAILADIMPFPGPRAVQAVVSIGDVMLVVGVIIFLVWAMGPKTTRKRLSNC